MISNTPGRSYTPAADRATHRNRDPRPLGRLGAPPRSGAALGLDAGSYRIAEALEGEAVVAPASFPGLTMELRRLWTLPR